MKKSFLLFVMLIGMVMISFPSSAANNDAHQVIVVVPSIDDLAITTGKPSVTINLAALGAGNSVTDNTSRYTVVHNQAAARKITAQVTSVDVGAALGVFLTTNLQAPVGSAGTSAGAQTILDGTAVVPAAVDVVTGVDKGDWTGTPASIEYVTYANTNATIGNNAFTVTYTLLP